MILQATEEAVKNWFLKYGEIGDIKLLKKPIGTWHTSNNALCYAMYIQETAKWMHGLENIFSTVAVPSSFKVGFNSATRESKTYSFLHTDQMYIELQV